LSPTGTVENVRGWLHSVESTGTLDGPGIRRVLFLQGCPLECLYCHNPDSRPFRCGRETDSYTQLREIARNREFLIRAGGGVTASGGEPLGQPDFVRSLFTGCREMGLHTALDTSGYLGARADERLLSVTDLVLLDIKHIRPARYLELTGRELEPTLVFARRLAARGIPVWIRHVLVPGYTDDPEALDELAGFVHGLGNVERIEVLPYHKMGDWKWAELGVPNRLADTPEPTDEAVRDARDRLRRTGLPVF